MIIDKSGCDEVSFVMVRYFEKYPNKTEEDFEKDYNLYLQIPAFKANQNIHEIVTDYYKDRKELIDSEGTYIVNESIKPEVHWIIRMQTQYYLTKAFEAMKIDLSDQNTAEQALGKGTPGRIAKMWCGANSEDTTELGSGRWNKEPAIAYFPNTDNNKSVITKEVDVTSCCSHHFLPFSTLDGGKAIISYIPGTYILGISKLQRFVNWAAKRFWLQEDLTQYIGETIKRIAETEDVKVVMQGLVHGCEKFRGAGAKNGNLTTEYKSGVFNKET